MSRGSVRRHARRSSRGFLHVVRRHVRSFRQRAAMRSRERRRLREIKAKRYEAKLAEIDREKAEVERIKDERSAIKEAKRQKASELRIAHDAQAIAEMQARAQKLETRSRLQLQKQQAKQGKLEKRQFKENLKKAKALRKVNLVDAETERLREEATFAEQQRRRSEEGKYGTRSARAEEHGEPQPMQG